MPQKTVILPGEIILQKLLPQDDETNTGSLSERLFAR